MALRFLRLLAALPLCGPLGSILLVAYENSLARRGL
jgi:hypothetical protein